MSQIESRVNNSLLSNKKSLKKVENLISDECVERKNNDNKIEDKIKELDKGYNNMLLINSELQENVKNNYERLFELIDYKRTGEIKKNKDSLNMIDNWNRRCDELCITDNEIILSVSKLKQDFDNKYNDLDIKIRGIISQVQDNNNWIFKEIEDIEIRTVVDNLVNNSLMSLTPPQSNTNTNNNNILNIINNTKEEINQNIENVKNEINSSIIIF